jgi:hypothetical protein
MQRNKIIKNTINNQQFFEHHAAKTWDGAVSAEEGGPMTETIARLVGSASQT